MDVQKPHSHTDLMSQQGPPDERAEDIRKLRWLGMQAEAERLALRLVRVPHTDCVMVLPAGRAVSPAQRARSRKTGSNGRSRIDWRQRRAPHTGSSP